MLLFFLFTRFYLYVLLFFLFPRVVLLVVVAVVAGFAVVVVVMVETVNRAPVEDTGLRAAHLSVVKLGCIDSSLKQAA